MIRARKGPFTHATLKRSITRVLPHVTGQLVGTRELPAAVFPRAHVRLFARMRSQVGLEMTRLGVTLAAARMFARVSRQFALQAHLTLEHFLLGAQ